MKAKKKAGVKTFTTACENVRTAYKPGWVTVNGREGTAGEQV